MRRRGKLVSGTRGEHEGGGRGRAAESRVDRRRGHVARRQAAASRRR